MEDASGDERGASTGELTSEGMVAAGADAVEVRIDGLDRAPLLEVELLLLDAPVGSPSETISPAPAPNQTAGSAALASVNYLQRPAFIERARWGANENAPSVDCVTPAYATRLDRFVVHHTAGTNSYLAADSPGIIRAIQRYHVDGRGWCDIGYNVLVDKYGQVFEGRRGGIEKLVVGVHASGHNTGTVGVSVLGNYSLVAPTEEAMNALVHVIGWKSYIHGLDPAASSMKDGTLFPNVIGHRDVAATACPGAIWNRLGEIASRAGVVMRDYQPSFSSLTQTPGPLFRGGSRVSAFVPTVADVSVTIRNGSTLLSAVQRKTVRGLLVHAWNGRIGDTDAFVNPGSYSMELSGRSSTGKVFTASTTVTVGYPAGMSPMSIPHTIQLPAISTGDTNTLALANLALPDDVTGLVLRACASKPVGLTLAPTDGAATVVVDPSTLPGGCGLVLVPIGPAQSLKATRTAGSDAVSIQLIGDLRASHPVMPFSDVHASQAFTESIQWIYSAGITTGNPDGTYRPVTPISRSAMAAFLYRLAGWPKFVPPARQTFIDVEPSHPFYLEVEWLAHEGISTGTSLGLGRYLFKPTDPVSRQAMAAFLFRLSGATAPSGGAPFPDVPAGGPFTDAIRWLRAVDIARGYDDGTFRPRDPVSRQAMAAFLHRTSTVLWDASSSRG